MWDRAIAAAEQLGSRLYLGLIYQEKGRLMRARSDLEEGLRLFDEIGAVFQVAQTMRYLGETLAEQRQKAAIDFYERALILHKQMNAEYEFALIQSKYLELQASGVIDKIR